MLRRADAVIVGSWVGYDVYVPWQQLSSEKRYQNNKTWKKQYQITTITSAINKKRKRETNYNKEIQVVMVSGYVRHYIVDWSTPIQKHEINNKNKKDKEKQKNCCNESTRARWFDEICCNRQNRERETHSFRVCSYSCFFLSSFFIELVPKKGESLRAASATSAKDTDFLQFL